MNITIYCVGKLKEDFYRAAVEEYSKRLSRYCKLRIIEVPDEKTPDGASNVQEAQIKEREGKHLLDKIKNNTYLIALAIDGKHMDSIKFSKEISGIGIRGVSDIGFAIGGSLGLSESVLRRADMRLSFSDMTFPHQLMRVILLEQVYRAFRIANNEPYHK